MLKDSCFKKALFEVIDLVVFFPFPGVDAHLNDLGVFNINFISFADLRVF